MTDTRIIRRAINALAPGYGTAAHEALTRMDAEIARLKAEVDSFRGAANYWKDGAQTLEQSIATERAAREQVERERDEWKREADGYRDSFKMAVRNYTGLRAAVGLDGTSDIPTVENHARDMRARAEATKKERDEARAKNRELNRRAQAAESTAKSMTRDALQHRAVCLTKNWRHDAPATQIRAELAETRASELETAARAALGVVRAMMDGGASDDPRWLQGTHVEDVVILLEAALAPEEPAE